ncbi:PilZ domain-containing protein [Novosphingobium tardum]|uniref:PilZ domain-containing protein n=1 Tax=Novosphingobium tardum TaxID=1538021 RepID=A0ABV8RMH9_9SPHN
MQTGSGEKFVEKRAISRAPVSLSISARERSRSAVPVMASDLSTHGCRIEGAGIHAQGTSIWIRLPGLDSLVSRIAWSSGTSAGVRFESPLHPAVAARYMPWDPSPNVVPLFPEPAIRSAPNGQVTRREQILGGVSGHSASPLELRKRPVGSGLFGAIRRNVARRMDGRREPRHGDTLTTGPMTLTVRKAEATVENVSSSGLMLRTDLHARIGDRVPVAFEGFAPLEGRIVWMREGRAGISLPPGSIELDLPLD